MTYFFKKVDFFYISYNVGHAISGNVTPDSFFVAIFPDGPRAYPPKKPAPGYKSWGLMMRPATAEAAVTAGLAR